MKQNKFGELIFSDDDLCNLLLAGQELCNLQGIIVDDSVNTKATPILDCGIQFSKEQAFTGTISQFHEQQQKNWLMPDEYKNLDIAAHVLGLCKTQAELQRCGEELMLYQERNLFDLLRYLKYLVDLMKQHRMIWGVGRGSSVASYVLYLLEVHRIDSIFYNLDIQEFLR